ncbi:MAG: lysine--tRNA ligase [Parcubacteria group bacterium]|nr:lysine--tRNA ligase [Parcubacteria group bacterium]
MSDTIHDERQTRIEKLAALRAKGVDPYPARANRTSTIGEALASFDAWSAEGKSVTLAGRIRLLRRHGGLTFARLEDESGDIQVMLSKKGLGEEAYELLKEADMADFIAATGKLIVSKTGEKTVEATTWTMLTKAILPLPEKWHGLKNEEERYRCRYVDLIVNPEVKNFFRLRSRFIASMRAFLLGEGFMEVETPVLEHVPGGAEAEPFITHHNTMDIDLYLRISLELHLKRLIVGGYEKIFEIGKVFRNEGMSPQHLQEFTEMEFYWAYADNEVLMGMVQRLYQTIIKDTFGTLDLPYKDQVLHFGGEWPRLNYVELLREHAGIDLDEIKTVADMRQAIAAKKIPLKIDPKAGLGRLIDQVYKKTVRPKLVQPCFLVNHPVAVSPLAKRDVKNPNRVERHQVLIATAEVGNAFSELNDPLDQRQRFEDQMALRAAGDNEAQMIDEDYLRALEHGMPPTAGFGVGIDRLLAILTNQESIRDTVLFPTMRPE